MSLVLSAAAACPIFGRCPVRALGLQPHALLSMAPSQRLLEQLAALDVNARDARLQPVDALLQSWPEVRLEAAEAARFLTGSRMEIVPFASTLPAGEYWLGHMFTSSTSVTGTNYTAGTVITSQSRLGLLENAMGVYKRIGNSTTNATTTPVLFHGYLATTTVSASSAIGTVNVRSTTGRMYWNYAETTV